MKTIIIILVLAVLFLFLLPAAVLSYVLYSVLLVRNKPEKWARELSLPEDEEYARMYEIGFRWEEEHRDRKTDVSIESDGFRLAGEYFDFGFDRAVIVIPGRMESCRYSYFFAEPFYRAGYNVLAIDNRSHGLSEGKRCSLGYKEYRDIIRWAEFLHREKQVETVVLHGICIGASTALFALLAPECPEYLVGMCAEGMYSTFAQSFKNHMLVDNRPIFPIFYGAMLQIRLFSGANVVTDGPAYRIHQLKKPILFLHSRMDQYSLPEQAELLYQRAGGKKELHWFSVGTHSRIRINNMEEYDRTIMEFLRENF